MTYTEPARQLLLNYFENMRERIVFYRFVPGGVIFLTVHYGMIHDITGMIARVTGYTDLVSYNIIPMNLGDDEETQEVIRRLSVELYGDGDAITFSAMNPANPSKLAVSNSGIFRG
jgi:hypothetical protein